MDIASLIGLLGVMFVQNWKLSLISIIMLFMIKYTSWPHYPEKTFQS